MVRSRSALFVLSLCAALVPSIAAHAVTCGAPGAANLEEVIALGSCTVEDKSFGPFADLGLTELFNITAADVG
jgi:hypothetical protein